MSSLMHMTKQAQYLYVKQKLDSFNLPTNFPFQSLGLLSKLVQKLEKQTKRNNMNQIGNIKASSNNNDKNGIQVNYNFVDKALRSQLSKTVSQNNQLHIDLITLKQQNQARKHCLDKLLVQKSDNKEEIRNIITFKNQRQTSLIQQLQVAKFKYNQLIDFIHQQDNLQKMYIKRLFNHKKYDIGRGNQDHNRDLQSQDVQNKQTVLRENKEKRHGGVGGTSSKVKDSRRRINKTLQYDHNHKQNPQKYTNHILEEKLHHLQQKLSNRQKQIERLHAKITYDGLNLNNVLVSFNDSLQRKKMNEMQERLSFMEVEYQKIKKELDSSRNKGGRYEALRLEVDKCHEIIKDLKHENKNIKRMKKENDYDLQKERKQMIREIGIYNGKAVDMKVVKYEDTVVIEDLRKKVRFYQKQFGKINLSANENGSKNKVSSKKGLKKSIKVKGSSKKPLKSSLRQQSAQHNISSQLRQRYQDQIKLSLQKGTRPQTSSGLRRKQLASATSNNRPSHPEINQIPQQQQSSESNLQIQDQIDQQIQKQHNQQLIKQQQNQQNQNVDGQGQEEEQEQSSQQQQQRQTKSQLAQNRQTLLQQYQQTINQLTNKYLSVKEELEVKNEEIMTLERVVDKFMKQKEKSAQTIATKQLASSPNKRSNDENNKQQPKSQSPSKLSHLTKQVQQLSVMLNQSQFQKQQLRRQVIQMQQLYKRINFKNQKQINSGNSINQQYKERVVELEKILVEKEVRLEEYRLLNQELEDRLGKSIDRVKRLNDQVDYLSRIKEELIKELEMCKVKLDSVAYVAKEQHRKHSQTIQLAEVQKNEIIALRKELLAAEIKIGELQNQVTRKQVSKLRH